MVMTVNCVRIDGRRLRQQLAARNQRACTHSCDSFHQVSPRQIMRSAIHSSFKKVSHAVSLSFLSARSEPQFCISDVSFAIYSMSIAARSRVGVPAEG